MSRIYKPLTKEQKEKISTTHKLRGVGKWLIGKPSPFKGKTHTIENREKMRLLNIGKKYSKEVNSKKGLEGNRNPFYGKKHSEETISKMQQIKYGEKNPNWNGGITSANAKLRNTHENKLWRSSVLERDNHTCVWCGFVGKKGSGEIVADHIKPFILYPEIRFAIDNGRTLCVPCHKTTNTYGFNMKNYVKAS